MGIGILLPEIGAILGLLGTLGSVLWYSLLARSFFKMGWIQSESQFAMAVAHGSLSPDGGTDHDENLQTDAGKEP